MNIVICKNCHFAIGSCVCGKKQAEVIAPYRDDPRLLVLLDKIETAKKIFNTNDYFEKA